jgi:hypothetical protein
VTKNETSITTNFIIFKNENEETVILNESYWGAAWTNWMNLNISKML